MKEPKNTLDIRRVFLNLDAWQSRVEMRVWHDLMGYGTPPESIFYGLYDAIEAMAEGHFVEFYDFSRWHRDYLRRELILLADMGEVDRQSREENREATFNCESKFLSAWLTIADGGEAGRFTRMKHRAACRIEFQHRGLNLIAKGVPYRKVLEGIGQAQSDLLFETGLDAESYLSWTLRQVDRRIAFYEDRYLEYLDEHEFSSD